MRWKKVTDKLDGFSYSIFESGGGTRTNQFATAKRECFICERGP
jgi:hypothetical protein